MDTKENFFSNPDILQHFSILQSLGIFSHIESLQQEIRNYKTLFSGATDIFHRTTIDEILETTVLQISDKFLPSFLVFLWRPLQIKRISCCGGTGILRPWMFKCRLTIFLPLTIFSKIPPAYQLRLVCVSVE